MAGHDTVAMQDAPKRKKKSSRALPPPSVTLTNGDWLDVMDSDGVWNVARVLSVVSDHEVRVMYDGWPPEYDEVVRIDSDRVAPYHTYTWAVKCWVKYKNWPMWPSLITIRTPGNAKGVAHLRRESRLYVDFLDSPDFGKRDRCWNLKKDVRAFDAHFDANRRQTNGEMFENSLQLVLRSNAVKKLPKFVEGTLPVQYADSVTESVKAMRRSMTADFWVRNFANNRERHLLTHLYEDIGKEPDVGGRVVRGADVESENESVAEIPLDEEPQEIAYEPDSEDERMMATATALTPRVHRKLTTASSSRSSSEFQNLTEKKTKKEQSPRSPIVEAGHLFPSVLVMRDEIIVVDDEDGDGGPRKTTRRARQPSTPRKAALSSPVLRERRSPPTPTVTVSTSLTADSKELPESAEAHYRKLAAKDITSETRQQQRAQMGVAESESSNGHKELWLDAIMRHGLAESKDKACDDGGEDVGSEVLVEENCEADSTTVAAISSLPASAIPDEPVNSFLSPEPDSGFECFGGDNDATVGNDGLASQTHALNALTIEVDEQVHPSSHSQPTTRQPDADSHSVINVAEDSQQPEELERFVDRASSLSRQDKETDLLAATETEKRSNLSLAGGKRSVVDEIDLAFIPTPDELMADSKEQEPQVPPAQKKQRKGSSSSSGSNDSHAPMSTSRRIRAGAAKRTPSGRLGSQHRTETPTVPIWSRALHGDPDDELMMSSTQASPPLTPPTESLSSDNDEESKSDSSSQSPTKALAKRAALSRAISEESMSASTSADLQSPSGTDSYLSEAKALGPVDEVIPDIPRQFCIMRVNDRVESSMDEQSKLRPLQKMQNVRVLLSAPAKFAERHERSDTHSLVTSATTSAGDETGAGAALLATTPSLHSHSSVQLSPLLAVSGGVSTPPRASFSSSDGFSLDKWFKRNLYAKFLKPM